MAVIPLDALGLKCPQPVLKIAARMSQLKPGDTLEVIADCPSFSKDIKMWCDKSRKTLLFCRDEGGGKFKVQIQF